MLVFLNKLELPLKINQNLHIIILFLVYKMSQYKITNYKMDYLKTIVIDNGTGFTKMGYAGNATPSHKFPTCIATLPEKAV